jgi:hypothetical protein
MKTGGETLLGQPVTDHDGDLGQGVQDHSHIRFERLFHRPAAKDVNHVVEQTGIGVGDPFHGLFTSLLEKRVAFPSPFQIAEGYPSACGRQALAMEDILKKRDRHPGVDMNFGKEIP